METDAIAQAISQQIDAAVGEKLNQIAASAPWVIEQAIQEIAPGLAPFINITALAQYLAKKFIGPHTGAFAKEGFRAFEGPSNPMLPVPAAAAASPARIAVYERMVPKVCVAPGCTETQGVGPRTGFTCPKHRDASQEQKVLWRQAFAAQERQRLGHSPRARSKEKGLTRNARAAENDARILEFLKSQSKKGASLAEISSATGLSMAYLRKRIWRLREKGLVQSVGNTSKARHYFVG